MAKAVLCPVCNGSGELYTPLPDSSTLIGGQYERCHGCDGKGWVEVAEDKCYYHPRLGIDMPYSVY